jgi:predicted RecB family nuclease
MATKITRNIIESYLNCKYKGHLKLAGEIGTPSDYETMTTGARTSSREQAIARLVVRFGEGNTCGETTLTTAILKQAAPLLADADLEAKDLLLRYDALKRVDGDSKLGKHHYVPILYNHENTVGRQQRILLAILGLVLTRVQGLRPADAIVAHGPEARLRKVRLVPKLYRKAEQILGELGRLQAGGESLRLTLNSHCHLCEFRQRCRTQAEKADDISLLRGVGEKELARYNRKGIFTLTQLSCTFRPRRRSKRVKRNPCARYSALQALAIREKKIHVYGTPDLPRNPVQIFLDAEGNEDGSFIYLLGILVVEDNAQRMHSFWADSPVEEVQVFEALLDLLTGREDFALFHYGSYEKTLLKRMKKVVKRRELVDLVLSKAVNVLSVLHPSVYFPTFSNGLKEIGGYLGCTWTDENASGLQSLVWRARWEQTREPCWKEKLLAYNAEDCVALRTVTTFVQAVGEAACRRGEGGEASLGDPAIVWADAVAPLSSRGEWRRPKFALHDFDHVNRCAYFDYQRERVFLRTNKAIRRACLRLRSRKKRAKPLVTREVEFKSEICPYCKSSHIIRHSAEVHKLAYDLKFTAGGIRRQVIRCTARRSLCRDCGRTFLPKRYLRRDKHLHGLKSWAMYQLVVHRLSLNSLEPMFEDCFGLRILAMEVLMIKVLMARRYRETLKSILARIIRGGIIHIDETQIDLQHGKGYVWVLTSMEDVLYLYKPSRETAFLQDFLSDFKGVLICDFYPGYESLSCMQQACLVHLIRDMNDDLLGSPYDEEFKTLAGQFGKLLRSIVETIDRYGLKKFHLHKHKVEVAQFLHDVATDVYRSQLAESYQKRLGKNEHRLFTFLDHDGVPWNNNAAEHAIKAFACFRQIYNGQLSEEGLSDFLVLLSVQQTCKYRGASFLKFLLSGEEDIETFYERRGKRSESPIIEIYPDGFSRTHRKIRDEGTKEE